MRIWHGELPLRLQIWFVGPSSFSAPRLATLRPRARRRPSPRGGEIRAATGAVDGGECLPQPAHKLTSARISTSGAGGIISVGHRAKGSIEAQFFHQIGLIGERPTPDALVNFDATGLRLPGTACDQAEREAPALQGKMGLRVGATLSLGRP